MPLTNKEQISLEAQFKKFMARVKRSGNIRGWHVFDFFDHNDTDVWLCYGDNGYLCWREDKLYICLSFDHNYPERKMRWEAVVQVAKLPVSYSTLPGGNIAVQLPWGERIVPPRWYAMVDLLNPYHVLTT